MDFNKYATVDLPQIVKIGSLGVCAKLMFGNISAASIAEWFEYQRLMKVDKVIAYTYKLMTIIFQSDCSSFYRFHYHKEVIISQTLFY